MEGIIQKARQGLSNDSQHPMQHMVMVWRRSLYCAVDLNVSSGANLEQQQNMGKWPSMHSR